MKVEWIELFNYASYRGLHRFPLTGWGLAAILGRNFDDPGADSNGSGKSGLVEALRWCWFGEVPKGDHVDSIINDEPSAAGEGCYVRTGVTDDEGRPLVIRRARKVPGEPTASTLRLWVAGEDKSRHDVDETQKLVDRELGLDDESFRAGVMFGQGDRMRFCDATDGGRMELVTKLLPELAQADALREPASVRASAARDAFDAASRAESEAAAAFEALSRVDVRGRSEVWARDRAVRLDMAQRTLAEHRSYLAAAESGDLAGVLAGRPGLDLREECRRWHEQQQQLVLGDEARARAADQAAAQVAPQGFVALEAELGAARRAEEALALRPPLVAPAPPTAVNLMMSPEEERLGGVVAEFRANAAAAGTQATALEGLAMRAESTGETTCGACGQRVTAEHARTEAARLRNEAAAFRGTESQALEAAAQAAASRDALAQERAARGRAQQEANQAYSSKMTAHGQELRARLAEESAVRVRREALERASGIYVDQVRVAEQARASAAARAVESNPWVQRQAEALANLARAARDAVGQCELLVAAVTAEVDPNADLLAKHEAQLATARADLERKRWASTQRKIDLDHAQWWVDALGAEGLRSHILDGRVAELSDAANEWVRGFTGGTVWVEFATQKQLRGKGKGGRTAKDALHVRVHRWNPDGTVTERGYRSWSGGEKERVSLAVDLGLSQLVARRAAKRYDLIVFDEVFKHLDRKGRALVMDALRELAAQRSTVLVIDHDGEFQARFDRRIIIEKRGGRSTIITEETGESDREESEVEAGGVGVLAVAAAAAP